MVSSQHIQESLALVIGIYLNSRMLLEYYLIMPILKLKSGSLRSVIYYRCKCELGAKFDFGVEAELSQANVLRKGLLFFSYSQRHGLLTIFPHGI